MLSHDSFGKNIGNHLMSKNILQSYLIFLNVFLNKMEVNVNVLGSQVRSRILDKSYCTLIISMHNGSLSLRITNFLKKCSKPYCLLCHICWCHIFSFYWKGSNGYLFLQRPRDVSSSYIKNKTSYWMPCINITSPIWVSSTSNVNSFSSYNILKQGKILSAL